MRPSGSDSAERVLETDTRTWTAARLTGGISWLAIDLLRPHFLGARDFERRAWRQGRVPQNASARCEAAHEVPRVLEIRVVPPISSSDHWPTAS